MSRDSMKKRIKNKFIARHQHQRKVIKKETFIAL
jgi:hypothetical protein